MHRSEGAVQPPLSLHQEFRPQRVLFATPPHPPLPSTAQLLVRAAAVAAVAVVVALALAQVQGALDAVCPPVTALELAAAWPEADLVLVARGGHSMYDPGLTSALVEATDQLLLESRFLEAGAPTPASG